MKSFVCCGTIFKDDSRLKSFKRWNPRLRNVFQTPDDWDTEMALLEELSVNLKDSSKENEVTDNEFDEIEEIEDENRLYGESDFEGDGDEFESDDQDVENRPVSSRLFNF